MTTHNPRVRYPQIPPLSPRAHPAVHRLLSEIDHFTAGRATIRACASRRLDLLEADRYLRNWLLDDFTELHGLLADAAPQRLTARAGRPARPRLPPALFPPVRPVRVPAAGHTLTRPQRATRNPVVGCRPPASLETPLRPVRPAGQRPRPRSDALLGRPRRRPIPATPAHSRKSSPAPRNRGVKIMHALDPLT